MNTATILSLLATMIYLTVAAAVPPAGYFSTAPTGSVAKRVEATFAWREYFVRNCTALNLTAVDVLNKTIDGNDCENLSAWQSGNNGGYYELWDFNHSSNYTYRPIVGHDTCVIALHHSENGPNDYAVIGSLDVIDLIATVLSRFELNGKLPTIGGSLVCGPNRVSLNILIYNGRTGWQGTGNTAVPISLNGAAGGTDYNTGSPPPMPVISVPMAGPTSGT
ncbi:hypothetical protein DHEL01_v204238 [Diaporthe helianthi]|uniref:Ecp2 effector protein-like domain-containing protein n=1 Tax=Diaporthe helianthi TaxID=158607 RepID=A0A2P5I4C5_DIAHE|nr:hypothetical protein DHEL01_v204238 [Diaporthe helianthi]